mgnify:CR=1 FL=1
MSKDFLKNNWMKRKNESEETIMAKYAKKTDMIRNLSELRFQTKTQVLITEPENFTVQDYYKMLLDSPLGEEYECTDNTKYIIVELLPRITANVTSMYGDVFESGLTFWDNEFINHSEEEIHFELDPMEYDEDDCTGSYPIENIKAVGVHCTFNTTPITSMLYDGESHVKSGVSNVYLSTGGPIFTAISERILDVIQLLTKAEAEHVEYPEDVVLEFVIRDVPYVNTGEPRALMKELAALTECLGYRFMELSGRFFEKIRISTILLVNPQDTPKRKEGKQEKHKPSKKLKLY